MSMTRVTERGSPATPLSKARLAGVFYLLTFITGFVSLFAAGRFIVSGDAAATASNILANETSFRWGLTANLLATVCYVGVTALFYELFKPVNRSLALLAACASLVGCAVGGLSSLFQLAPMTILGGAMSSSAFKTDQLETLAFVLLKLNAQTTTLSLVFFGCYCLLIGCLIFRSIFLPRVLGLLMALGGLGWLTGSFASLLSPPLANALSPYILTPGILGEGALTLWLLVVGVNPQRWKEQAAAARRAD
jgi:hypothetical protein